jgi:CRP/FNR family transcriptional regulator, cyclic AMP receptor protein
VQTIDELIAGAPAFAGLREDHLRLIAGCARNEHAHAGTFLFHEGDPADRFYLIRTGTVRLEVHSPARGSLPIETIHAHEVVGWSWLFEPYRWQLDARVLEPSNLVSFDAACLRGKSEQDHELGYQLMRRFAALLVDRLQATRFQLLDVYGHAGAGV